MIAKKLTYADRGEKTFNLTCTLSLKIVTSYVRTKIESLLNRELEEEEWELLLDKITLPNIRLSDNASNLKYEEVGKKSMDFYFNFNTGDTDIGKKAPNLHLTEIVCEDGNKVLLEGYNRTIRTTLPDLRLQNSEKNIYYYP